MPKFYGRVGYSHGSVEYAPQVWKESISERRHYGDVVKNATKWRSSDKLNDDLIMDQQLRIIADPYALANYTSIRYIEWMGHLWNVIGVSIQRPRLILTIGGVYNEQSA